MRNSRLRNFLSRFCSSKTMERIVDPILTDIEAEPARARWAGYVDLARALTLNAISTSPRQWLGNDAAVLGRLAGLSVLLGLLIALVSNVATYVQSLLRGSGGDVWFLWLLPGAIAMTIPAALLIAVPVTLRNRFPDKPFIARALGLAVLYSAALFVLVGWVVPEANQSYRTASAGREIARGPGERSFLEARRDIAKASTYIVSEQQLRRLEFAYHSRLAIVITPVSVMLLALAVSSRTKAKRHPYMMGVLALLGYTAYLAFARSFVLWSFVRGSQSPVVLAWGPFVALALCGAIALYFSAFSTQHPAPSTQH